MKVDRVIFCVFLESDVKIYEKELQEFFPVKAAVEVAISAEENESKVGKLSTNESVEPSKPGQAAEQFKDGAIKKAKMSTATIGDNPKTLEQDEKNGDDKYPELVQDPVKLTRSESDNSEKEVQTEKNETTDKNLDELTNEQVQAESNGNEKSPESDQNADELQNSKSANSEQQVQSDKIKATDESSNEFSQGLVQAENKGNEKNPELVQSPDEPMEEKAEGMEIDEQEIGKNA